MTTTADRVRDRLMTAIRAQLDEYQLDYPGLAHEVAGIVNIRVTPPTDEQLQAMLDAAPDYMARVRAERADRAAPPAPSTAEERLAALEDAIRDGLDVRPAQLAQVRAEAQAEQDARGLAEQGRKAREKAAQERAKLQATALEAVRNSLPALPADADEKIAAARAALDDVQAMVVDYTAQVQATAAALTAGGFITHVGIGTPDGETTYVGHGYVCVEGTIYAAADRFAEIRRRLVDHPVVRAAAV